MIYGVMMVIQTKTGQITGMRRIECDETIMVELSFTQLWQREYCTEHSTGWSQRNLWLPRQLQHCHRKCCDWSFNLEEERPLKLHHEDKISIKDVLIKPIPLSSVPPRDTQMLCNPKKQRELAKSTWPILYYAYSPLLEENNSANNRLPLGLSALFYD